MEDNVFFFLEDERIGLRRLEEEDVSGGYCTWLNDKTACQYNSHHRFPVSKRSLLDYVHEVGDSTDTIVFAIIDKEDNTHIGNISLQQIDLIDRSAEIAFLIGAYDKWGKGYATAAGRLLIDHAFRAIGLHRVFFGTSERNTGMQKVGEKLGFVKAGTYRDAIYKDGRYWDVFFYDLLDSDWKGGESCEGSHK